MQRLADPLWPVLMLCAVVVAGTSTLEIMARERRAAPEIVRVLDTQVASASAESESGDDGETLAAEASRLVDDTHRQARALARRGELEKALLLFEQLLQRYPDSGFLHADFGYWLIKAHEYERAVDALDQARALGEDTTSVAINLGAALRHRGDKQGAEKAYRHALDLNPGTLDAQLALARLLARDGRLGEALTLLEKASAFGSNDDRARALLALGRARLQDHQSDRARRAFEEAINRAPSSADLRVRIADAWLHDDSKGSRARALKAAEDSALLAPDDVRALTLLGRAREANHDRKQARLAYERALELSPEERYPRRRLLRIALAEQNFEAARRHAEALVEYGPEEPEHYFLSGLVAARDERVKDAREHYEQAIDKAHGNYPEAWFNLGLLEKHAGRFDAAIEAYEHAIELRPNYLAAMNNLGLALAAGGRPGAAEAMYQRAVSLDAQYAPAWKNLARLYENQNRYERAVDALERAVRARPNDISAARRLAAAKLDTGDTQSALEGFQRVLQKDPQNSSAWIGLSEAQAKLGQHDAAGRSIARALKLAPESIAALRQRASLALLGGEVTTARKAYQDLLARVPGDVALRITYAELLKRSGDFALCFEEATRALRVQRDSSRARELKTSCQRRIN